jgi:hypothetical protein
MGGSHGPILKSEDDSMVLARLQACCPPAAIRAHLQDGYLAGDYSILKYPQWYNDLERDSNLQRRLIAKFRLHDNGEFWNQAYPVLTDESLLPLKDRFIAEVKGHLGAEIERRIKTLS